MLRYGCAFASSDQIAASNFESYGGRSDGAILSSIHRQLDALVTLWGFRNLVRLQKRKLAKMRDEHWPSVGKIASQSRLQEIKERWQQSINWHFISEDLKREISPLIYAEMPHLQLRSDTNERIILAPNLIKQIKSDSRDVAKDLAVLAKLRREFDQDFTALQAATLNKKLAILTFGGLAVALVALVIAILSVIIAWFGLDKGPQNELRAFLQSIW